MRGGITMSQPSTEQEIESQQVTPPQPSEAGRQKKGDFLIGFFGWFAFNGVMTCITVFLCTDVLVTL